MNSTVKVVCGNSDLMLQVLFCRIDTVVFSYVSCLTSWFFFMSFARDKQGLVAFVDHSPTKDSFLFAKKTKVSSTVFATLVAQLCSETLH